jgi:RNA polymerase sigma-70 factor (ECF subfamily)
MTTTAGRRAAPANISPRSSDWKVDERVAEIVSGLVDLAKAGDRDAFGELYRRTCVPVGRLARFYLGDAAEDAVAETFVRAWAALPRYRATGAPFVSWLYGIARHVVADELAARRRVEPRGELPDTAATSEEDDRLALSEAMARLPREQRQVLELKYLVGLKNGEVARAMRKTTGAVNALQWRALRAMRGMVPR